MLVVLRSASTDCAAPEHSTTSRDSPASKPACHWSMFSAVVVVVAVAVVVVVVGACVLFSMFFQRARLPLTSHVSRVPERRAQGQRVRKSNYRKRTNFGSSHYYCHHYYVYIYIYI